MQIPGSRARQPRRALGTGLLKDPREALFLMSEVPLYTWVSRAPASAAARQLLYKTIPSCFTKLFICRYLRLARARLGGGRDYYTNAARILVSPECEHFNHQILSICVCVFKHLCMYLGLARARLSGGGAVDGVSRRYYSYTSILGDI